jgi:hypothetical protein
VAAVTAGRTGSNLLSFVSCERIFRWWRSALRFFRGHFLLRDWSTHRAAFAARSPFCSAAPLCSRSPLRCRATFGTCPGLGGSTSFCSCPPFCSCSREHGAADGCHRRSEAENKNLVVGDAVDSCWRRVAPAVSSGTRRRRQSFLDWRSQISTARITCCRLTFRFGCNRLRRRRQDQSRLRSACRPANHPPGFA